MSDPGERGASLQVLTPDERRAAVATARAISDIREARARQVQVKGYSPDHDDQYRDMELERGAVAYALGLSNHGLRHTLKLWPWGNGWWKPRNHRENLVRAGALIVAAIEKIDRAEGRRK